MICQKSEETNDSLFGLNDFNEENEEFDDQDNPETDDDSEYIEEEILDEDKNRDDEDLPGRRITNNDPRYFIQLKEDTTSEISKKEVKLIEESLAFRQFPLWGKIQYQNR